MLNRIGDEHTDRCRARAMVVSAACAANDGRLADALTQLQHAQKIFEQVQTARMHVHVVGSRRTSVEQLQNIVFRMPASTKCVCVYMYARDL